VIIIIFVTFLFYISLGRKDIKNPFAPTELVYKTVDGKYLKLDVYFPKDTLTKHKTIIYFHGGSWISGTKLKVLERYRFYAVEQLLKQNIEIISVDYRLIRSNSHLNQCLEDCHDAVKFCLENADYLEVDTSRIGLWGSSAGAHLAMLVYGKRNSDNYCNFKNIKFLIDDFGPTDIYTMWSISPDWFKKLIATDFYDINTSEISVFDSLSREFSPNKYCNELRKIPILISHGSNDKIVNFRQSESLHDSLAENSEYYLYDGQPHGFKTLDSAGIKLYAARLLEFVADN